jgi:hypothetical protein
LLRRAVHLSRAEFPFLAAIDAALNNSSVIDALRESAARADPGQAHEGFLNVLATLVTLLESFIGEDLTFRLLRDVWPELPVTPNSSPQPSSRTGQSEANP